MANQITVVNVVIHERDDGGVFVTSPDLIGLVLSGSNPSDVVACIEPAIEQLFKRSGYTNVTVRSTRSASHILAMPNPQDVDVCVNHDVSTHGGGQFVVELRMAA